MKKISWVLLVLIVIVSFCWGGYMLLNYNPLRKYGVSYKKTFGEHAAFQSIQFYWNQNGKKILGPRITGDELYVKFEYIDGGIPCIVIRSQVYKKHVAVLKLNFTDLTKPEFMLIENKMMGVEYFPPWGEYYDRDPETHVLRAKEKVRIGGRK